MAATEPSVPTDDAVPTDGSVQTERPEVRHGNNLYPVRMEETLGPYALDLDVPEGVWNPTPHGVHLGNMLAEIDFGGKHVLELGTGCGLHAIVIARQGAASITMTEIEEHINANAEHNLRKHDVAIPMEFLVADWTSLPSEHHGRYDMLVTNPPFGKSGKRYRRYFIDTLILDAHKFLKPGGELVFIQSSMADIPRTLRYMQEQGMVVQIVGEVDGPFRKYYFEDPAYLREMASIPGAYSVRDGTHYERLMVFRARLPADQKPPV